MTAPAGQTVLVAQEGPGQVTLFPAAYPSQRTVVKVGEKPHEIEIAPGGRIAYVSNFGLREALHKTGTPGTTISVIDIEHAVELRRFHLPEGYAAPHGLKLRPPQHNELFTNTEVGREAMVVFNAHSREVIRTFVLPRGVHNFVFDDRGSALFAFTLLGDLCRIDPDSGTIAKRRKVGSPRGITWTQDRKQLIVSGVDEVLLVDPARLETVRRYSNLGVRQIFYPAMTMDSHWILAPAVLDGVVVVIDAASREVVHRVRTGSPLMVTLTAEGRRAWISNVLVPAGLFGPKVPSTDGGVVVVDLKTFQTERVFGLPDANGLAVTGR